jgi:hypothetical protein
VARHQVNLSDNRSAFELALELRARTGLAALGDLQQVQLGLAGAWEGDQDPARSRTHVVSSGWRPGHTLGVEVSGAVFPGPTTPQGTTARLGATGGGLAVAGGLILAQPFELMARAGYMGRAPQRDGDDYLHGVLLEGGTRLRWGWAFAELDGGVVAPFGTLRDRVQTTVFAGGALGARFAIGREDEDGTRVVLGARTRIGLMGEHTFDALLFSVGLEWEGGLHAPPFPRVETPAASGAVGASGGASVGVSGAVGGSFTGTGTGAGTTGAAVASSGALSEARAGEGERAGVGGVAGGAYTSVPLGAAVGLNYGYVAPIANVPLERTVGEWSLALSWTPSHWLAFDARAAYWWAASRTEDLDGDGVNDRMGQPLGAVQLSAGARLRLLYDEQDRQGWSFGLFGGYWIPASGFDTRSGGVTVEAAVARHVGTILDSRNVFGLSLELRARTGLGDLSDLQTLTLGTQGFWEGNVRPGRSEHRVETGWRPGHTFALDAGGLAFLDGGRRPNGRRFFDALGYSVGMSAGVVLAPVFELGARIGYLHRPGVGNVDALAAGTIEAGPRVRYGWLAAQAFAGYAAVFGTQRYEVASGAYAGFSLQARPEITDRWHVLLGLTGRFGLGEERALDHIGLTLGFEFEGGRHRAPAFPSAPPSTGPVNPPASDWREAQPAPRETTTTTTTTVQGGTDLRLPPVYGPRATVSGGARGEAEAEVQARPAGPVELPLRFTLGAGGGVNSGGLLSRDLEVAHYSLWAGAGWVPARWLVLEANGAYLNIGGHVTDTNGDGRADSAVPGLAGFAGTLGARLRLLREDGMRYGWSLALAGGVLATSEGTGPLAEAALGRHVGTLGEGHMSFELGVEARARYGYIPGTVAMGPNRGNDFASLTVGLTGAWEGHVVPAGARGQGYEPGETLHLEGGYAFFVPRVLRNGAVLGDGAWLGVRTGVVFTPAMELSARAAWLERSGGEHRDPLNILLAEAGPRFRWGWAYAEVQGGYAGAFGSSRDYVTNAALVGAGLGVRAGLTGPGRHWGIIAGVHGRVGLSEERVYDQLVLSFGLEFEGGNQQAAPFPAWLEQAFRTANDVAAGRAAVGVRVDARVAPLEHVVLAPGFTMDADDVGRPGSLELTTDDVQRVLPEVTDRVVALRVEVRAPSGVDAAAIESVVVNAVRVFYQGKLRVTARVVAGARRERFGLSVAAE